MPDTRSGSPEDDWRLVPYIAPSGHSAVMDFLGELHRTEPKSFIKFHEIVVPRLEERGPFHVGPPMWEGLGDGLWEIRWGRCRIYCSIEHVRRVFMYDGVIKRWRAFDKTDRQRCQQGRADVASGDYDEEEREYLYHDYCQKRQTNGTA